MSVRAVAVRNGPHAIPVPASTVRATERQKVVRSAPRVRGDAGRQRRAARRFADDTQLIGLKMLLLALLMLVTMALEVPF